MLVSEEIWYSMRHAVAPPEEATVKAFIVRARRDRFLALLPNPKRRHKFTESLAHPNPQCFDARFVKIIPPPLNNPESLAQLFRGKVAARMRWTTSAHRSF